MKICFIAGTLARGGAEKQLVFMLRALRAAKIEAKVLCLTRGEFYETEIKELGFEIEYVGASGNQPARVWRIIKCLRRERASVVQSAHFYTNLYAALAGKILRIKSIGAVRSDLNYEIESHPLTGKWQIRLPDLLIVNSRLGRERLIERGIAPAKAEFVRNVVEINGGDDGGIAPKLNDDSKLKNPNPALAVLFAGRLDENKRPAMFVRLAARLVEKMPAAPLEFLIAGDGVLRESLEKSAAENDLLRDKLRFLGACQNMCEIYRRADILVSTSRREGTPNVILEAMAHSLAIAATDAGGTAAILDRHRGSLVGRDDEEGLFRAVLELIENPARRQTFGASGQRYVRENHSLDRLQIHLSKIYERLVGNDPKLSETGQLAATKIV